MKYALLVELPSFWFYSVGVSLAIQAQKSFCPNKLPGALYLRYPENLFFGSFSTKSRFYSTQIALFSCYKGLNVLLSSVMDCRFKILVKKSILKASSQEVFRVTQKILTWKFRYFFTFPPKISFNQFSWFILMWYC